MREKIYEKFDLKYYVNMKEADAFLNKVTAYPSIFAISPKGNDGVATKVSTRAVKAVSVLESVKKDIVGNKNVVLFKNFARGNEPWLLDCPESLKVLRKIESQFLLMEEEGCKVGIGVASGE